LIADGEVSDTIQYIRDKHVMVVPLISGGGIRVKIIEAMAAGKAVISTTIGAEGIPYTHGVNILIADTREEFARHVGNCMASRDYCNRIGAEAGRLAREHYDLTSVSRRSDAFYKKVLENKPVNV
jgi:glycosyltransferase involved in cell wall biosynthesis